MKVLRTEKKLCPCCMEEHAVQTIAVVEKSIFKNESVEFAAEYDYCERADECFESSSQMSANDVSMKNAYRVKVGLLTSDQIASIRAKYGISQSDLSLLLGWGGKTITRYESHQVQDAAHDTVLRKLESDPEWFLSLLRDKKDLFSSASYEKYAETGAVLFEQDHDSYLRSAIMSKYARFARDPNVSGNKTLSLDTATDMIRYIANASSVTSLYLVKLLKMMWYADALSYKRRGHAISGLVYRALPMGAVPVAYESIIDLSAVLREEVDMGDCTAYRFLQTNDRQYPSLSAEDKEVLDAVIRRFGRVPKNEIVETMHREDAYIETALYDVIQFKYAKTLSMS